MVDRPLLASRVAAVRDAVARIRDVLPPDPAAFLADRTAREIVVLNLFVGVQECVALASHWLADEGWSVPSEYRALFRTLAEHGVIAAVLAERLGAAAGLRNLVAHRYGILDWERIYAIAEEDLEDLLAFCEALVTRADESG